MSARSLASFPNRLPRLPPRQLQVGVTSSTRKVTCTCGLKTHRRVHQQIFAMTQKAICIFGLRTQRIACSTLVPRLHRTIWPIVSLEASLVMHYALTRWAHGALPQLLHRLLHRQQAISTHQQIRCGQSPCALGDPHQDLLMLAHTQQILLHQRPVSWAYLRRSSNQSQKASLWPLADSVEWRNRSDHSFIKLCVFWVLCVLVNH